MVFGLDDAIILAGISAAATAGGGLMSQSGQASANAANVGLARENMAWQEHMSNTAYQRAMADMRAAGLNPILAYQKGGASTPGMSMPHMENEMGGWGPALQGAVSSAQNAFKTVGEYNVAKENVKKIPTEADVNRAQVGLVNASEAKTKQETVTSATTARLNEAATKSQEQDALNKGVQNIILGWDAQSAQSAATIKKSEAENAQRWGTGTYGNLGNTMERAVRRMLGLGTGDGLPVTTPFNGPKFHMPWSNNGPPGFVGKKNNGLEIDIRK